MSNRRTRDAAASSRKATTRETTPSIPTEQQSAPPTQSTSVKDILAGINADTALQILVDRELIPGNGAQLSLPNMLDLLTNTAENLDKTETDCRIVMSSTAKVLNLGIMQMIATATASAVTYRLDNIRTEEQQKATEATKQAEEKMENERRRIENDRMEISLIKSRANNERKDLEDIRKSLVTSASKTIETHTNTDTKIDNLSQKIESLIESTLKHGKAIEELKHAGSGAPARGWGNNFEPFADNNFSPENGGISSYADITTTGAPARSGFHQRPSGHYHDTPDVDRAKNSEGKRDRQLLLELEAEGGNALTGVSNTAAFEKAKSALEKLVEEAGDEGRPTSIEIVTVKVQRGKALLIEMSSTEEKDWLTRPDVCEKFARLLGVSATYKPRKFPILAEQVPVAFQIDEAAIAKITEDNGFQQGDIIDLRWIRNPASRAPEQKTAHLVINCKTKQAANEWIKHRKHIGGKAVESSKLISDAFRCFKCQLYGHKAETCISEQHCGTCGGKHDTKACNDRNNTFCITCNEKGHPTWDKSCPGYYAKSTSHSDKVADRYYTYFITEDPETWELAENRTRSRIVKPAYEPRPIFVPNMRWTEKGNKDNENTPRPTAQIPPSTPPNREQAPHLRPDNLARPTEGGVTFAPRQQASLFASQGWSLGTTPTRSQTTQQENPKTPMPSTNE